MPASWVISSFPRCSHHVFLSHCAEDRDWLVLPLVERLTQRRIIPWLDRHHYPSGTDSFEALREGILHSRHVIYLVTLGMLDQGRGWTILEKTYAGLLQENLRGAGLEYAHIELPLFLVARDHPVLRRSVWQAVAARGIVHAAPEHGEPVGWAARQIERFVRREQHRALEISERIEHDPTFRTEIGRRHGLMDRIRAVDPILDPPPESP